MPGRGHVLIVEDVPALAETYAAFLRTDGCHVDIAGSGRQALAALAIRPPEVMVLDVNLPDVNGLAILREIRDRQLPTDVIVVTSQVSISLAVTAMQQGAFDYLTKPFTADRLRVTVRNALERRRLETQVAAVQDEVGRDQFCGFIGRSMAMQSIYRILTNAAASSAAVLVTGERGTGKRLCGQALHKLSRRRQKPFVEVDCAALSQDQLDAEIFGRWARVATADREGALLRANGGTLFLDEVCDLGLALQDKLLGFLQTGSVQRIDEDRPRPVDVRLVCATARDPRAEIAAGRFSEELLYRLEIIPVRMPPLRERDDDVLLLARHFLREVALEERKTFKEFSPEAEAALLAHDWPGNTRELRSVLRGIVVLNEGEWIEAGMLPDGLRRPGSVGAGAARLHSNEPLLAQPHSDGIEPLRNVVRRAVEEAIRKSGGNIPRAAAALEVTAASLYRHLQAWQAED